MEQSRGEADPIQIIMVIVLVILFGGSVAVGALTDAGTTAVETYCSLEQPIC